MRAYFHSALWEEEKHYSWFLHVILGAIVLVIVRMPEHHPSLYLGIIFVLSYLGGFISQIAFNVINYECAYFQIAFRRHVKVENRLFNDSEAIPPREWKEPTMWGLLLGVFRGRRLGVRGNFLAIFSAFDKVFLLAAGIIFSFGILYFIRNISA